MADWGAFDWISRDLQLLTFVPNGRLPDAHLAAGLLIVVPLLACRKVKVMTQARCSMPPVLASLGRAARTGDDRCCSNGYDFDYP